MDRAVTLNVLSPYKAFCQSAAAHPARDLVRLPAVAKTPWAPEGYGISYAEAAHKIDALRAAYVAAGYGRGSRVAFMLENRPEFLLHWLALNAIGASIVPLNGEMRPEELAHQMQVSGAELVVSVEAFTGLLSSALPAHVPVSQLNAALPTARQARAPGDGLPEDEAALLFTSGSTGKPKACILSNLYFSEIADWYRGLPGIAGVTGGPVAMTPLPFYHMNALACTAGGIMAVGGTIVPLDRFHPKRWWRTVAESGATLVHGLGVIPAILLQLPPSPDDQEHKARAIFSPGVDAAHKTAFEARFGLPILEGWAMTETGGAAVTDTGGLTAPLAPRCIGRPRGAVLWRIVDEAGQDAPVGELILKAPGDDPRRGFFSGYLGDTAATEAAWEGGWFRTGDIVRVDDTGLFYFVDRKKSIVRRSGENISALEVEAALMDDPAVRSAAVTPVPDSLRGEEVFAFVVPAEAVPGSSFAADLLQRLTQRLSYHKLPGYLALVDELPLGSTQKVLRGQVKSDAAAAVQSGQALDLRVLKGGLRGSKGAT